MLSPFCTEKVAAITRWNGGEMADPDLSAGRKDGTDKTFVYVDN